jgi:hypothetical protein
MKYLFAGWLIPIGYAAVTYGLAWITGIGAIPTPLFLQRAAITLGLHDKSPTEIVLSRFVSVGDGRGEPCGADRGDGLAGVPGT